MQSIRTCLVGLIVSFLGSNSFGQQISEPQSTKPLTIEGDLASEMVDGIDRFLLRKIDQAAGKRSEYWNLDISSAEAYNRSIEANRSRLGRILGMGDERLPFQSPEFISSIDQSAVIASTDRFKVLAIRWPVLAHPAPTGRSVVSIYAEGLLLEPNGDVLANVVALPDADQSPEQLCGLVEGVPEQSQFARRLAEQGCRVVVPTLISRERSKRNGRANLTNREYVYRPAFELGRHVIGYELQKVLTVVDWFESKSDTESRTGVFGYGEGGMLALYAAALDTRIDTVCVSGFFGSREACWQEPLDRNVFGLLREFGAAELATMVMPRHLVVEVGAAPQLELSGEGGAPAVLRPQEPGDVENQLQAASRIAAKLIDAGEQQLGVSTVFAAGDAFGSDYALQAFLKVDADESVSLSESIDYQMNVESDVLVQNANQRQLRQLQEMDRHNQALLAESPFVRDEFMKRLDTSSIDAYQASIEKYRDIFRTEVIGEFDEPLLPLNARSRKSWETEKWTGHEVVLDVFPDVMAYGVLLLPKDLKPGEKRPVVVCQHGLEGRPTDTFLNDHRAYHDFAAKLCEQGFITFAPQNPYIFQDRFRTLQRKANPLGKTLFSVIVPQHQQIVNWLKTQSYVDDDRIAFYGLSYGGKSAMRIPALVTDYCLSICSADFNEWVHKNASTRHNFSYVWTGEYEIFEWDLGSTFNYAEMAALICPRPFMVERGHFDGVGKDEWVAFEYAKVRHLYAAKLGIADKTEIEWFVGPHTINGQGTYRFLQRHLDWPARPVP